MFDIDFYMKFNKFRKNLTLGLIEDSDVAYSTLEAMRNRYPIVYTIETTNACNMSCKMCPRTTMMTRSIQTMDPILFQKIVDQLQPHSPELWSRWEYFVEEEYGINKDGMSENHFFLYIIPKVIQLHGYGDPLLDKNMASYVALLASRKIQSYFSCNPANIDVEKTIRMFQNGLNYIKYSIESVYDDKHREIRGSASNFTKSYDKIQQILEIKKRKGLNTTIVITMLDLNRETQKEEFDILCEAFAGLDVYLYLKSEDQQWYRKDFHGTNSIHWSEACKHPWMSMTVKSNGDFAMCMEDFNNEILFGNASENSLSKIWNGEKYAQFRKDHIWGAKGMKCTENCDMKIVNNYL